MTHRRRRAGGTADAAHACALASALGCMLACASPATPPTIPATPAGRAFRTWLGAYNAADSARLAAYARAYEPTMSVHTQLVFRAQTGPWDVASVERSEPRHLDVTLRTRAASTVGLVPLATYAAVDLTDGAPAGGATPWVTTRLAFLGTGSWTPVPHIRAAERTAALDSVVAKLSRNYVDPDVARRVADSLRARQARGAYDDDATAVRFAYHLDRDLRALGGDQQLGVEYARQVPLPPPTPAPPALLHCGLEPARALEGGVEYVRVDGFGDSNPTCGHEVSAAMNAVAGARALVIDLRENTDESRAGMAELASYLVAGCTHLGDLTDRRTGRTEPLFSHEGPPGPSFGGMKPLVLLTSARTLAAAEALAAALQRLGRATVIGERTGGGAHTTALGQVGEHLLVRIPVARAVAPVTHASWQGVGIEPDVLVPAGEALATAQRLIREGRVPALAPSLVESPLGARQGAGRGVAEWRRPRRGIRFSVDTLASEPALRGLLSRVAGVVEFADGRGRLDVSAVSRAPAVSLAGVTIREPLARPGDYYLFDNTGFLLVRPSTRTFARIAFGRADFNHTGALLAGAFLMRETPIRTDTLALSDAAARRQHGPVSVHWHAQPRGAAGPLYARGWLEIEDVPAVEAGVARWFEVAAALATRPGGLRGVTPDGVDVSAVALFHGPDAGHDGRTAPVTVFQLLAPRRLAAVDVGPERLVLPAGYTEAPWPGFGAAHTRPPSTAARWRTLEDAATQRARAACRQAWVPDARDGGGDAQ